MLLISSSIPFFFSSSEYVQTTVEGKRLSLANQVGDRNLTPRCEMSKSPDNKL